MSEVKMCKYVTEDPKDTFTKSMKVLQQKNTNLIDFNQKGIIYTIEYKMNSEKIVFVVNYGNPKFKRCYDRPNNEYDNSILSDDMIHMDDQFIFIMYEDKILCSDHNKRNIILNFIKKENTSFNDQLLSVSNSFEEFITQLHSVESISITAINNLFINEFLGDTWFEDLALKEKPETTKVDMTFNKILNEKYIKNIYKKLINSSYISAFDIKGKNDDGFISINESSVITKEKYDFEKVDGYYDIEEIFAKV